MVKPLARFLVALALSATPACSDTSTIPGTKIPDTEDNREVLKVLERYRYAFVQLDPAAILATAHPTYFDAGGTDDPGDDVVYEELGEVLRSRTAQLDSVRFMMDYLRIYMTENRATVDVWIDASFRLKPMLDTTSGKPRVPTRYTRKQDYSQFELVRDGASWRITRGL